MELDASAAEGPVSEGYVTVSRWVNEVEAKIWLKDGGTSIPSGVVANNRLYVTLQGAPKPGGTGQIRIDFLVPDQMLQSAGDSAWRQIIQPQRNTPIYNVQINYP